MQADPNHISLETNTATPSELEQAEIKHSHFNQNAQQNMFSELLNNFKIATKTLLFIKIPAETLRTTPLQLVLLVALSTGLSIFIQRFFIEGSAYFYTESLMWGWWMTVANAWLCWVVSLEAKKQAKLISASALFAVTVVQDLILSTFSSIVYIALIKPQGLENSTLNWIFYGFMCTWGLLSYCLLLTNACRAKGWILMLISTVSVSFYVITYYYQPPWYWYPDTTSSDDNSHTQLILSQSSIEKQLVIAQEQRQQLKAGKHGTIDLYGISFAPYAADVFVNESHMIQQLMRSRFSAEGHMQELINHSTTLDTKPWASTENLERAINTAAEKMNRDEDILFVYLTSHGGKEGTLSAYHWPLEVDNLTPSTLNLWLDKANIKNRIIVVSACYSGSWIAPLKNANTLILTAADATHTSFGCGKKSALTYFGRALFDEQLKITYSFENAFKAAIPIIKQREIEGKKDDGFSNPQMSMGTDIKDVLMKFEAQLAQYN